MKTEIEVLQELIKEVKLLNAKWMEVLKSIPNKDEPYVHDYTASPTFPQGWSAGKTTSTGCLWDTMSEEDKKKPMGLSCPCPKCSPQC